ncbi:MAG TPA: hypothetical protein VM328_13315, partial [Fimbriimonadaceae bacterium]|nr:hypothetical protein [Fimbriimonadaceae bacterium]
LLSRPISRFDLLMGKLLGGILVSWLAFLMLAVLTAVALLTFRVPFEPIMLQYVAFKMMGLVVLCAVTLTLSTFMTPAAAATMSFVLAFGSSMISRALVMSFESSGPVLQWVFRVVDNLLPRYGHFDLGSRAANIGWSPVPTWVMLVMGAYMLVYGGSMLALSWLRFRRQPI